MTHNSKLLLLIESPNFCVKLKKRIDESSSKDESAFDHKGKKSETVGHFYDSSRLFSRQQVMVIQNPKSVDDRCKNEFIGSCERVLGNKNKI